jgi:integrase
MKNEDQSPVVVCHSQSRRNRFFGKYKDPDESDPKKRWKKIPGGPFPKDFDTKDKALVCARRWYETEIAARHLDAGERRGSHVTWPELCDLFIEEVSNRVRGADASRDELKKRAKFLRAVPLLCSRPVAAHDDKLAVSWGRKTLSEPRRGSNGEPRDALTVRNIARVLQEIYKFARASGYFPQDHRLPTEAEEFKAEISGALKEKAKLGLLTRVPCPVETARAVVNNTELSELRRVMTYAYALTGVRPGEAHGWRLRDYREEYGVVFLDVREQWTLARTGFPSRLTPPKTLWGRRKIPVHPSLEARLDQWLDEGWEKHVGRKPEDDDFLFPDSTGVAFREVRCDDFIADVRRSGCETSVKGVALDIYSLRHTFATAARRAGISSDARDRLLGHRPRDTKSMHYEDEDLPVLAAEVAKLPAMLELPAASASQVPMPTAHAAPPTVLTTTAAPVIDTAKPTIPTSSNPSVLVPLLVPCNLHASGGQSLSLMISAEEKGFEPSDSLHRRRFSKPLP